MRLSGWQHVCRDGTSRGAGKRPVRLGLGKPGPDVPRVVQLLAVRRVVPRDRGVGAVVVRGTDPHVRVTKLGAVVHFREGFEVVVIRDVQWGSWGFGVAEKQSGDLG
jgi:hypothetical protein